MTPNTFRTRRVRATVVDLLPRFGIAYCSDDLHSWAVTKSTRSLNGSRFETLRLGQLVHLDLIQVEDAEVVSSFNPLPD